MDYSFINIPTGIRAERFEHSFIYGGCRYPVICGNTQTEVVQPTQSISSRYPLNVVNSSNTQLFSVRSDGKITISPDTLNEIRLPKVNRRFS